MTHVLVFVRTESHVGQTSHRQPNVFSDSLSKMLFERETREILLLLFIY